MRLPQGYILHDHDVIGSTNDEAKRLAREEHCPSGTIVRAKTQTAGRGRQGRQWQSPEGNLYVTFVYRTGNDLARSTQMSFVTAVALAQAIGEGAQLKWPNDVLINSQKVAGILLEAEDDWLVIGIGVNLKTAPEGATIIPDCTCDEMLERLAEAMAYWHTMWEDKGFAPVRERWLQKAFAHGSQIRARFAYEDIEGIFEDLDESGALVLRLSDGSVRLITSGEVFAV